MNNLKLITTAFFALTLSLSANESQTPSETYTAVKNSTYISQLEKERANAMHERDTREAVRQYMMMKREASQS